MNGYLQGVEAVRCKSFTEALKAGKPVRAATHVSLADGLAVPTVGLNAFVTAQPLVDKVVTVRCVLVYRFAIVFGKTLVNK